MYRRYMKIVEHKQKRRRKTQDDIPFDPGAGAFQSKGACQYLGGISLITLRRLVAKEKIRPNRELRHLLFPRVELDRFLAAR